MKLGYMLRPAGLGNHDKNTRDGECNFLKKNIVQLKKGKKTM